MQQTQPAQHVQQVQHAQKAQHQPQHVTASCQHDGEDRHTGALTAGDYRHENTMSKDSTLHHPQPPTQDLHHCQPHMKDLGDSQPQSEGVHDGQPKIADERNDWRQQGLLPVAQWLNQADDASRCVPGPDCNAPGQIAGLDDNAVGTTTVQQVNISAPEQPPTIPVSCRALTPHLGPALSLQAIVVMY